MAFRNILIITDNLYPNMNANSEIAYRIAERLFSAYNYKITMLGYSDNFSVRTNASDYIKQTVHVKRIEKNKKLSDKYIEAFGNNISKNKFKKLFKMLINPKAALYFLRYKLTITRHKDKAYYKILKKTIKQERFDCIITFSAPSASLMAVHQLKTSIPTVFYKLDAWSNNYYVADKEKERKIEEKADKSADAIIATDLIYNDYKNGLIGGFDEEKIFQLEFPNIVKYETISDCSVKFDADKINCVFTGNFYEKIRSPEYVVKLFTELGRYKKIVFHIFGNFAKYFNSFDLPSNIIYHGKVNSHIALACMQQADVLVNVGNTILNQMPSKILTYIALGKPILNIIKNPNCPTLKYTQKYPLALNILETKELSQKDVKLVSEFIFNNKGKIIPFEEIKRLYPECTIEFVGKKVYDIIENIINNKKLDVGRIF